MDAYTRAVLSVIAVALSLLAARAWVEPAWAQSTECRVTLPSDVRIGGTVQVDIEDWPDPLQIQPYSSSSAGSSSTWPLYVKMAN